MMTTVNSEAARWLNEARVSRDDAERQFSWTSTMTANGGVQPLFMSAEYALKAVVVQHHGSLPKQFETHDLTWLARRINLLPQLPADLQTFVSELGQFDPNCRYPREVLFETLVSSSTPAQWWDRLTAATRFIDYIDHNVIGDPAVFGTL